jgi:hypothetical protein
MAISPPILEQANEQLWMIVTTDLCYAIQFFVYSKTATTQGDSGK